MHLAGFWGSKTATEAAPLILDFAWLKRFLEGEEPRANYVQALLCALPPKLSLFLTKLTPSLLSQMQTCALPSLVEGV